MTNEDDPAGVVGAEQVVEVIVPQVGEAVSEVTLTRWLKRAGDPVAVGEPIFELDTEKSTVEVEAFSDGILTEILVEEESRVTPLEVVARISNASQGSQTREPSKTGQARTGARVRREGVSPRAVRLAADLGVDLAGVTGTGEEEMVTVSDVRRAADAGAADPVSGGSSRSDEGREARLAIARKMQTSKQRVPHFYLHADIEMSAVARLRQRLRDDGSQVPTVTAVIVHACGRVLRADPALNVSFIDGLGLQTCPAGSIGVAVAGDRGLLVPVVAEAGADSLMQTATEVDAAVSQARSGRLTASSVLGRNLVVSNLGTHGIDGFFAIINEPDPMILSVGRIRQAMVVKDGQPTVGLVATMGLAVDHRALDGVDGARFLRELGRLLESADDWEKGGQS